jgi:hypothetical protein
LNLSAGIYTLTVTVTDSATGMSSQDQITTNFEKQQPQNSTYTADLRGL